jgi:hypothetical protein
LSENRDGSPGKRAVQKWLHTTTSPNIWTKPGNIICSTLTWLFLKIEISKSSWLRLALRTMKY